MSAAKDYEDCSTGSFSDDASWNSGDNSDASDDGGSETILKDESPTVSFLKVFTIAVLLLAAGALSCGTFFLLRNREADEFESAFVEYSTEILDAVEERIQRQATAAEFFATTISSYAESSGQAWPFVSVPDLDISALFLASAVSILFSPLVSEREAAVWDNFTGGTIAGKHLSDINHTGSYMPLYYASPANHSFLSYDLLHQPGLRGGLEKMLQTQAPLISDFEVGDTDHLHALPLATGDSSIHSLLLQPVFNDSQLVGAISLLFDWREHLKGTLKTKVSGPLCVVVSSCNTTLSFQLDEYNVSFLGQGDYHDTKLGAHSFETTILFGVKIFVWPTERMEDSFATYFPILATSIVSFIFIFAICLFSSYVKLARKQKAVLNMAKKSNALITSLFPAKVRDRLMEEATKGERLKHDLQGQPAEFNSKCRDDLAISQHKPKVIADRYPECTVFFLDLVGFTAWSSQRSPELVFCLLETIFESFDKCARRRRVYKVETIGDCYLAVTGIPNPQEDHAKRMAKFALECLVLLSRVTRKLSKSMGYDTVDLKARIGLNSGPVTAGVLRGERGRFQLYGDTVNTASRMESTGEPGKIQISHTVEALLRSETSFKIVPRGLVAAKGKGSLQTFWLLPGLRRAKSISTSSLISEEEEEEEEEDLSPLLHLAPLRPSRIQHGEHFIADLSKTARLIDWMVELLGATLNEVVGNRGELDQVEGLPDHSYLTESSGEVVEVIEFPERRTSKNSSKSVGLSMEVCMQLRDFVTTISFMYRNGNPFHNFEHAGKVLLSMAKFLTSSPGISDFDPLTRFSCLFASLIHDVDHTGKSNQQLVEGGALIAEVYTSSVAEQHSLDLALSTLMEERFADLRACIFPTEPELKLFRQVTLNLVLATDIFGPLGPMRWARWNKVFPRDAPVLEETETKQLINNRKKTSVLELMMQACDVAHTMQHFDVYCKWNSYLFSEMNQAYESGSAKRAPSEFWYTGELGFFDNYVIPLAKQLGEASCFFGKMGDECLSFALQNRTEWKERGEEIVAGLVGESQRNGHN